MGIFQDVDGIFKYLDQGTSSSHAAPALTPDLVPTQVQVLAKVYTNEFLYNKICSIDNHMNTRFDNLSLELLTAIANSNRTHEESEEEMDEEET